MEKVLVLESHGNIMERQKYIKSQRKVKILPEFALKMTVTDVLVYKIAR